MIGSNDYGRVTGTPGREDRSAAAVRASAPAVAPMAAPLSICPPNPAGWHTEFTDLYIHGDLYFCGVRWNPTLGSAITVNSTPVYSGSNGRIAFDNAGLFGEAAHILTDGASTLTLGISATPGAINLNGIAGSSVALLPPLSGNTTFRLPATDGSVGQVLSTDGAGNTSWVAGGGAGTVTSVTMDPGTTGLQVNSGTAPVTINTSGTFLLSGVLATSNGGTGTAAASNTANGVAILSGSGILDPSIGGTGSSTVFTQGSVIFAGAAGSYTENNPSFFWDDAFLRLGINTNTPTKALDIVGDDALINDVTVGRGGSARLSNTAVGNNALLTNTTGTNNTAVGISALRLTTIGLSNTGVGSGALSANVNGSQNTAVGASALLSNTSSNNVAVGDSALSAASVGQNTAVGSQAMQNYTGLASVAIGYRALQTGNGDANTAIGRFCMSFNNVIGANNTCVGMFSAANATTGDGNSAFGSGSLTSNTSGSENTAIGRTALYGRNGESYNTAVGSAALYNGGTGSNNTAIGYQSLWTSFNSNNTAIGYNSGYGIANGSNNTIIGCYDGSTAPISTNGDNFIVLSDGQGNIGAYWEGLTGNQVCSGPVIMKGYTVGTLPTPTVEGMRAYVTDALAPAFLTTVVGGGAVTCPVFFDGTNWVAG